MSFPDPLPLPFLAPFLGGDVSGFWPQIPMNIENPDSLSQFENAPPFKRPRNSGNNIQSNSPIQPVNPPNRGTGTGHIFYKTRLCQKFFEGKCGNGDRCTFAHGPEDLREPPPNWQEIVASKEKDKRPGNWNDDQRMIQRMKICRKFYNGEECPYGDKCNFLHEDPSKFKADMGKVNREMRESSAISIGTTGPMMVNKNSSDQAEANKEVNPGSDAFRVKPFWKTRLCSKWETTGFCPFGERCHFAHGLLELQPPGSRIEAELVGAVPPQTKPMLNAAVDTPPGKTVICTPLMEEVKGKKSLSKWKGPKKVNRIYADWIDDLSLPQGLPGRVES